MVLKIEKSRKLILILGLQKSGTTLLLRLLELSGVVKNPFFKEGHDFWGDLPPDSPSKFPTGHIYMNHKGENGHEIGPENISEKLKITLNNRLKSLKKNGSIIVNKNPYNTVRLPWLRKLFKESYIIGMVRKPVPNVFSLLKKFFPHKERVSGPKEGWWGVKPSGWRNLIHDDKTIQLALQWQAVNLKLWQERKCLDRLIYYQDLCSNPSSIIENIINSISGKNFKANMTYPQLHCFDSEYQTGSRFCSKNKYYIKNKSLSVPFDDQKELEPFTPLQINTIKNICDAANFYFGGLD